MITGHRSSLNIWCALIGIAATSCLVDGNADHKDMAGVPAAAPELSKVSQAGTTESGKAIPPKPQTPAGVTTDGTLPPKPAADVAADLAVPWTVNLVASVPSLWPGHYTTLTATTNMDVGPTPYYIRIWDEDSASFIATCGTGTTCEINSVTRTDERTAVFKVVVATAAGVTVASAFASVYWHLSGVRLTESETTTAIGGSVVLTTFTDYDIGPSPYWVHIQDDTTRTILRTCGWGITCSVAVSQAVATTHRYSACFAANTTTYPAPNTLECSAHKFVTWTNDTARVSLQPSPTLANTIVATSTVDATVARPIQIFNRVGIPIRVCTIGRTCSVTAPIACIERNTATQGLPFSTLADIERMTPVVSRVLPAREWAAARPLSTSGPTGNLINPCPTPNPQ